jgi:hypothetical protein
MYATGVARTFYNELKVLPLNGCKCREVCVVGWWLANVEN